MCFKKISFKIIFLIFIFSPIKGFSQVSFFNMPNPDMMPVGKSYFEYDHYQSFKNSDYSAYVARLSVQTTPFLEVGANFWIIPDPNAENKVVLATKWRAWLYQSDKYKLSMSPGSWQTIFFKSKLSFADTKHLFYDFFGLTIQHSSTIYTRLMFGGYGKYTGIGEDLKSNYGIIAGIEQRLTQSLVFVTDFFGGKGEGYGLAPGFVWYTREGGNNLPLYLAYNISNDGREYDTLLFEIGYVFNLFGRKEK